MKTLKDLMSDIEHSGLEAPRPLSYGTKTATWDPIVREYNNLWGAITDTMMSTFGTGYIITGRRVAWKEFTNLLTTYRYENCDFPYPFAEKMRANGLIGFSWVVNGQVAYIIDRLDTTMSSDHAYTKYAALLDADHPDASEAELLNRSTLYRELISNSKIPLLNRTTL